MVHVKNFSLLSAFLCELLFSGEPNEHDPEGFQPKASRIAELFVTKNFPDQMAHLGPTLPQGPHKTSQDPQGRGG